MTDIQLHVGKYIELKPTYEQLAEKVATILKEVLLVQGINYHAITSRAKEVSSFSKKIENSAYDDPLLQITDLAGIRIITYVEDDIDKVAEVVNKIFSVDPENSLDKSDELGIDRV